MGSEPMLCYGYQLMFEDILYFIVPIIAVWWMAIGGLAFGFVAIMAIAVHVFGRPVTEAGTGKPADPRKLIKTEVIIGGSSLAFAVAGAWMYWNEDILLSGRFFVVASVAGALFSGVFLWSANRRK